MTHPQKEKVKNDESEQIKNVVVMERVSGASKMCDIPFPKIHTKNMSRRPSKFLGSNRCTVHCTIVTVRKPWGGGRGEVTGSSWLLEDDLYR